jgi:hypothetical protein
MLIRLALACFSTLLVLNSRAEDLSARAIVERAHSAAGGEAWLRPKTLYLEGSATMYRDGQEMPAPSYRMWRQFPAWNDAAHVANGKVRIDAYNGSERVLQISFDGEHSYNENGLIEGAKASREWSENFGFGIIRFALGDGFELRRMPDDSVDAMATHVVQIKDPSGGETNFWIDQKSFAIRKVGFDTERGWHERIYSDFYPIEPSKFMQPGRVRLYYRGILSNDIRWTHARLDEAFPAAVFRLEE